MRYSKHYLFLFFSLLLVPLYAGDLIVFKWLVLPLAIIGVFINSGAAFPGLIIYATYSSNSYPIYLAMFLFSCLNFNKLGQVKYLFLAVSSLLPFVVWHVINSYLVGTQSIGSTLNQFYMYFTLFGFFYGYIQSDRLAYRVILVSVSLIGIIYLMPIEGIPFSGISFLSIALWLSILVGASKGMIKLTFFEKSLLTSFLLMASILGNITFTIIFSAILSLGYLFYLNGSKYWSLMSILKSRFIFILLFTGMVLSINNADYDSYKNLMNFQMSDVSSSSDLIDRAKMKLFADRAPIWKGVVDNFLLKPSWWFYDDVGSIKVSQTGNEFHGGAHNLYLETLRRMGFLPGAFIILIFITLHVRTGKYLKLLSNQAFSTLIFISVFAVNIIGSWSGNFPLMPNYAIIGMVLLGSMLHFGQEANTKQLKS